MDLRTEHIVSSDATVEVRFLVDADGDLRIEQEGDDFVVVNGRDAHSFARRLLAFVTAEIPEEVVEVVAP